MSDSKKCCARKDGVVKILAGIGTAALIGIGLAIAAADKADWKKWNVKKPKSGKSY